MEKLTPRQAEILELIRSSIAEDGMPPTRAEIARHRGVLRELGTERARAVARKTLREVRGAMGLVT